jgi:hypothetical protein
VQTQRLHVSNARDSVLEIRSELFVFPEVLEVFVTGRPDVLVVVCSGRPRPTRWLRALRAAGYESLARHHASANELERDGSTSALDVPRCAPSPVQTPTTWSGLPEITLGQAAYWRRAASR